MDGRIRELLANGTSVWNKQFFNPSLNPNKSDYQSVNSTYHLKVQVWTNGSYIISWVDGTLEDYTWDINWPKVYYYKKAEFALQMKSVVENAFDKSKVIQFLNGTQRYVYPPMTSINTKYENLTTPIYQDFIANTSAY